MNECRRPTYPAPWPSRAESKKPKPFKASEGALDGVITARRIDVGDFVSATGQSATGAPTSGSGPVQTGAPNQELFLVAQTKTLRVYVTCRRITRMRSCRESRPHWSSPQTPIRLRRERLVRTANAIDPTSLTLLSEVDVDNPDGKLLPGGYAQVHFDIVSKRPPMVIPGNSLIFRAQGPQVGVVDSSNVVHPPKHQDRPGPWHEAGSDRWHKGRRPSHREPVGFADRRTESPRGYQQRKQEALTPSQALFSDDPLHLGPVRTNAPTLQTAQLPRSRVGSLDIAGDLDRTEGTPRRPFGNCQRKETRARSSTTPRPSDGMADIRDLKSRGEKSPCGFDPRLGHY